MKLLTIRDVSTAELLTTAQKYTEHAGIYRGSIGLPRTDDPLMGEKVANFDFFKINQNEKLFSS